MLLDLIVIKIVKNTNFYIFDTLTAIKVTY